MLFFKMINYFLVLFLLQLTSSYPDGSQWKLAFNIHASDGHSFAYTSNVWEDDTNVGSKTAAFNADYKSYKVTQETANFIAIVRHQDGVCEAARVWKFLKSGKTLHEYLDSDVTSRYIATLDNYTSSYISPTMLHRDKDPIFSVDGGIVFNWRYSDNGVRIANSEFYCGSNLPGETLNSDDYWGLGNDYCVSPTPRTGCVFDVGVTRCGIRTCQGTDHGTYRIQPKAMLGQYAVYVSDVAGSFPCKGLELQVSMYDFKTDFDRINRADDSFVNFEEFIFDTADKDRDGELSPEEYLEARSEAKLEDTASNVDKTIDFHRIDRDNNGLLNFNEVEFDISDLDNNGLLSYAEYYMARVDNSLRETK